MMDKITVGIISPNRKLRFAYRLLLIEESDQQIDVVFEGLSLHELGLSNSAGRPTGSQALGRHAPANREPDVLFIDQKMVYSNRNFFFHYLRSFFPHSCILFLEETLSPQRLRKIISIILTRRNHVT